MQFNVDRNKNVLYNLDHTYNIFFSFFLIPVQLDPASYSVCGISVTSPKWCSSVYWPLKWEANDTGLLRPDLPWHLIRSALARVNSTA